MTRCGVLIPNFDPLRSGAPPPVVQAAKLAERLGFDGVWMGDHLACPAPVLDAPTCLAAAAASTERVSLGLSVMLLGLRQPAWAAKQLATLTVLSAGRLRLGVGVGGEFPDEFKAAGVPIGERGTRLDEALALLPALLGGQRVRHHGQTLRLDVPPLEPAVTAPPLLVGGRSDAALRRAARYADAWLPMWISPSTLARRAERLEELAQARQRPRPALALLVGVHVGSRLHQARRDVEAHLRGQYGLPLEAVERWTLLGDADAVAERLSGYGEVGVGEFLLMPLGARPLQQIERLAEVRARLTHAAGTQTSANPGLLERP